VRDGAAWAVLEARLVVASSGARETTTLPRQMVFIEADHALALCGTDLG